MYSYTELPLGVNDTRFIKIDKDSNLLEKEDSEDVLEDNNNEEDEATNKKPVAKNISRKLSTSAKKTILIDTKAKNIIIKISKEKLILLIKKTASTLEDITKKLLITPRI